MTLNMLRMWMFAFLAAALCPMWAQQEATLPTNSEGPLAATTQDVQNSDVDADQPIALPDGGNIPKLLVDNGCDELWLSETMAENGNIPVLALHRLAAGTLIRLPHGCKTTPPPEDVAIRSRQVYEEDRVITELRQRVTDAESSAVAMTTVAERTGHALDEAVAKAKIAENRASALAEELETVKTQRADANAKANSRLLIIGALTFFIVFASILAWWRIGGKLADSRRLAALLADGNAKDVARGNPSVAALLVEGQARQDTAIQLQVVLDDANRRNLDLEGTIATLRPAANESIRRVANLEKQLEKATLAIAGMEAAAQGEIRFKRECNIEFNGVHHAFAHVGFESVRNGAGSAALYGCPLCTERHLLVREGEDPTAKCVGHIEKCLGRASGARATPPATVTSIAS